MIRYIGLELALWKLFLHIKSFFAKGWIQHSAGCHFKKNCPAQFLTQFCSLYLDTDTVLVTFCFKPFAAECLLFASLQVLDISAIPCWLILARPELYRFNSFALCSTGIQETEVFSWIARCDRQYWIPLDQEQRRAYNSSLHWDEFTQIPAVAQW